MDLNTNAILLIAVRALQIRISEYRLIERLLLVLKGLCC